MKNLFFFTICDFENACIDGIFIVTKIINGIFIKMWTNQSVIAEHFIMNWMFWNSIDIKGVSWFFVTNLINALIHMASRSTEIDNTHILIDQKQDLITLKKIYRDITLKVLMSGRVCWTSTVSPELPFDWKQLIWFKTFSSIIENIYDKVSFLKDRFTRHGNNFVIRTKILTTTSFSLDRLCGA